MNPYEIHDPRLLHPFREPTRPEIPEEVDVGDDDK